MRSTERPPPDHSPSSSSPSSAKNSIEAARSSTTMPTCSIRWTVMRAMVRTRFGPRPPQRRVRQNEAACWRPTASERRLSCVYVPRTSRGASRPRSSRSGWGARRAQEREPSSRTSRPTCRSGRAWRWSPRAGSPGFPAAGTSLRGRCSTRPWRRSARPPWRSYSHRLSETATRCTSRVQTSSSLGMGSGARGSWCACVTSAIAARSFWCTASRRSPSGGACSPSRRAWRGR